MIVILKTLFLSTEIFLSKYCNIENPLKLHGFHAGTLSRSNRQFSELPFASVSKRVQCETIHMEMCSAYMLVFIQIKFISLWEVLHEDSFWNGGTRWLGNGLLEFGNVCFCGSNVSNKREILRARREPTTNSTHIWHRAGIETRPHWWDSSVLTTAPSLLPKVSLPRILFKWEVDPFTKLLESNPSGGRDSVLVDRRQTHWVQRGGRIVNYHGRGQYITAATSFTSFTRQMEMVNQHCCRASQPAMLWTGC